jgi:HK97 family phage prohead protease
MIGLLEEKDNIGSVKDVSLSNRTITGYLAHFNSVDYNNDVIMPGAFTKTLIENKGRQRFLNYHNFNQPHNKFDVLKEDQTGLYFEVKMVPGVSYSEDVLKLYDAGVLEEQSIGFHVVKKYTEVKSGTRQIQEMLLAEGSNVTLGMNSNAKFTGFKSFTPQKCTDQITKIMSFIRTGTVTDETFIQLELGLKQLQLYSYELGKTALETKGEPESSTQIKAEPQAIEIIKLFRQSLKTN